MTLYPVTSVALDILANAGASVNVVTLKKLFQGFPQISGPFLANAAISVVLCDLSLYLLSCLSSLPLLIARPSAFK